MPDLLTEGVAGPVNTDLEELAGLEIGGGRHFGLDLVVCRTKVQERMPIRKGKAAAQPPSAHRRRRALVLFLFFELVHVDQCIAFVHEVILIEEPGL